MCAVPTSNVIKEQASNLLPSLPSQMLAGTWLHEMACQG